MTVKITEDDVCICTCDVCGERLVLDAPFGFDMSLVSNIGAYYWCISRVVKDRFGEVVREPDGRPMLERITLCPDCNPAYADG